MFSVRVLFRKNSTLLEESIVGSPPLLKLGFEFSKFSEERTFRIFHEKGVVGKIGVCSKKGYH